MAAHDSESPQDERPDRHDALSERVNALETEVAALRDDVRALRRHLDADGAPDRPPRDPAETSSPPPSTEDRAQDAAPSPDASAADSADETAPAQEDVPAGGRLVARVEQLKRLSSEDWLSRVGIGLLLVGLAFLFQYSVEQGWLGPGVRVGFGVGLGSLLLAGGLRTIEARRRIGQVLLGGSSAAFYTTVYAAHQLYDLLPYPYAFASMVVITVLTVVVALRQDEPILAVVGVAGGLGTPFLLVTDTGSIPGLALYLSLIFAGAAAIYLLRGWRSVQTTSVVGGTLALVVTAISEFAFGEPRRPDRVAMQAVLFLAWFTHAGMPVVRAVLETKNPDRWTAPSIPGPAWLQRFLQDRPPYTLFIAVPVLTLFLSEITWSFEGMVPIGVAFLVAAALYVGLSVLLARVPLPRYAPVHGLAAVVLATIGVTYLLDGVGLMVVLAVEGVGLLIVGRRIRTQTLRWAGHALMGAVSLWFVFRLQTLETDVVPIFRVDALAELFVLAVVLVAARSSTLVLQWTYRGVAYLGWLAWTAHELVPLENGQGIVSAVWGATAVAMLIAGSVRNVPAIQSVGLATLALFVGKLFLIDLAALPAIWRILLFLGSGGLLLLISYSVPGLLGGKDAGGSGERG